MSFVDNTAGGRIVKEGLMPVKVTITDTCKQGDLIGYDNITHAKWERADANGKIPGQLVAGQAAESGDEIVCFKMAVIDFGSGSTATPGDVIYLADDVGQYAATPGSWVTQAVGQMVSATEGFIDVSSTPICGFPTTGTGFGGFIRAELASGKTMGTYFGGLRVDCKVVDGATVSDPSGIWGLYVMTQFQDTDCVGQGAVMRLEDTSSAGCAGESFIHLVAGGADQPDYALHLTPHSPTSGCWVSSGSAKTSASGWLLVKTSLGTQYINMYNG